MNNLYNNNLIFILIFVLFAYLLFQINNIKNSEEFINLTDTSKMTIEIINQLNNIYDADIQAIRNLSLIASKLNSGNNTTIPGDITISGKLNVSAVNINNDLNISGNINGLNLQSINNNVNTLSDTLDKIKSLLNNQFSQISGQQGIINSETAQLNGQRNIINSQTALQNLQAAQMSGQGNIINSQIALQNLQTAQMSGQQNIINSETFQISGQQNIINSETFQISGQQGIINSETAQISGQQNIINSETAQINSQQIILNSQASQNIIQASLSKVQSYITSTYGDFINLINSNPPWGMYSADNWNSNILFDITSNYHHAITTNDLSSGAGAGAGAKGIVPYISGTANSTIIWPIGSLPANFTIAATTRYSDNNNQRILSSYNGNWLQGHHGNHRGSHHYNAWKTPDANIGNVNDWIVSVGTNSTSIPTPNNILVDNNPIATDNGGNMVSNDGISINKNCCGQNSNWSFSELIIWDLPISQYQMNVVSKALNNMLTDGYTLNKLFKSSIVFSYANLISLVNSITPWGMYSPDSWANNTLYDLTNNGRHASTSSVNFNRSPGNGANGNLAYLYGNTSSTINWPNGSIPSTFTIASMTRYTGGANNRILVGTANNWLHGHWGNQTGLCHYDGWKAYPGIPNVTNWCVCVGTNNGNVAMPNNIISNNSAIGNIANGGSSNNTLTIGSGWTGELSNWAFGGLIIWDQPLNKDQMLIVSKALNQMLIDGSSLKSVFNK